MKASEERRPCVVQFFLNPMGSLWMNYIHYYLYVYYKAKQTNKQNEYQSTNKQQHRVCEAAESNIIGRWNVDK